MSGVGIPQSGLANILALARPDLAAQQQALQTRRAFAESLLGQQAQYSGVGGALDTLGSKLLGAMTERSTNKQALDIANAQRQALFGQPGDPAPQGQPPPQAQSQGAAPLSSMPPGGLSQQPQGAPQAAPMGTPRPPLASLPPGGLTAPPQGPSVVATPQPQTVALPAQPMAAQQPPQGGQSLFDQAVPDIPGVDPRKKFALYAADPDAYYKAYYASQGQTPEYKNALVATGGDPQKAAQLLGAAATKAGAIDLRSEAMTLVPDPSAPAVPGVPPGYRRMYGPNENLNEQFADLPNGQMQASPITGGKEAAAGFRGAVKGAEEENTILPEVTFPDGSRVPMYAGAAIGSAPANGAQPPLGVRSNNPGNLQPNGQESQFANRTAGVLAASSNLDNYAKNGINTLGGIISTWAPQFDKTGKQINDTPGYIADVSKRLGGIDPTKPLNLNDPNVKGAVLEAMFQHENGNQFSPPGSAQPSSLPKLGVSTAQEEVNKAAGEAGANSAHINANSDALLKAIDGMIAINSQVPDSTFLSPDIKATINEHAPNLPGFRGDAGALAQWEQLNSIGILGGIKNLGLGRVDIPIVKQIQAGGGIDPRTPQADRLTQLQTLKAEVLNNRAAAQNTASNLNSPNAAAPNAAPMQTYPGRPQETVPPPAQRGMNQVYQTPKGPMKWVGNGWLPQ